MMPPRKKTDDSSECKFRGVLNSLPAPQSPYSLY
jgi:hypothetical protein